MRSNSITRSFYPPDDRNGNSDIPIIESLKNFILSGEQRQRITAIIYANSAEILQETMGEWSLSYPDILACNIRQYAACVRDLNYFLRYLTYVTLAIDSSILSERAAPGYAATYLALNIPINATFLAFLAMQEVIVRLIGQEDCRIMTEYFDYLCGQLEEQSQSIKNNFVVNTQSSRIQSSEDWQYWEPKNPEQWLTHDKLSQQIQHNNVNNSALVDSVEGFFESLSYLPYELRRQVWREREIMAALYEQMNYWENIEGFISVGVARRNILGSNRLVGILSFISGTPIELISTKFDIPNYIYVDSYIPDLKRHEEEIPIVIEESETFNIDKPLRDPNKNPNPGTVTTIDTALILQGGEKIAGISNNGLIGSYVTLTTFVKPINSLTTTPYLLTVRHGFSGYRNIIDRETKVKIGEVISSDMNLDIVIAKITLDGEYKINSQLKWINEYPKKPLPIFAGMPVQMYGATSGHVLGIVDESIVLYPGINPSFIPDFSATISTQPGDSGALLVVGHNSTFPIPAFMKGYMSNNLDELVFHMQGVFIAASTNPLYPKKAIFRPMSTILHWLKLEPYIL